jgi:hypothetical protein
MPGPSVCMPVFDLVLAPEPLDWFLIEFDRENFTRNLPGAWIFSHSNESALVKVMNAHFMYVINVHQIL